MEIFPKIVMFLSPHDDKGKKRIAAQDRSTPAAACLVCSAQWQVICQGASLTIYWGMWFEFVDKFRKPNPARVEPLLLGSRQVPLLMVRHPRARRYLLRLRPNGTARVTIPRGGSATVARQFVERNRSWLEEQYQRLLARPRLPSTWQIGSELLFRGESVRIQSAGPRRIRFGSETLPVAEGANDLRPTIETHFRKLATRELSLRVVELARRHGLTVNRVTVRNQRTRWGSCSRRGTISLNWRLIQTPESVRDYIVLHELAHTRHMNHSRRFWQEVERLCPDYQKAERWLKQNRGLLHPASGHP